MGDERDVIFEFIRIGTATKVTAVDTATGIEATIVGDPTMGETALKRVARQKLRYVMERQKK